MKHKRRETKLTHTPKAIEKDTNILYEMPTSLFYMYRRIMKFLIKKQKKELALVVTETNKNWVFYISDANGKSIHKIVAYQAELSHAVTGQGFDFFETSALHQKEQIKATEVILCNIQKSVDFNYCDTSSIDPS